MSKAGAWLKGVRLDPYILALVACVVLASLLPARGGAAVAVGWAAKAVIAAVFFLHGAKLSRRAVLAALLHWRLHLTVLAVSFVVFPAIGLASRLVPHAFLTPELGLGVVYLCCLPSTIQSSIAFTSIARGDVAAAVCSASASNLLGLIVTPALVALLMGTSGAAGFDWSVVGKIMLQLLGPFVLGQLVQPWMQGWIERHRRVLAVTDRGSVLFVVYSAFSEAVIQGVWTRVSLPHLAALAVVCAAILALVLLATRWIGRAFFSKADEIVLVFCGSKKSLVTGAPMAAILFPPAVAGLMILPLMLFHQMQLMACAVIAQRYGARVQEADIPG